MNIPFVDLAIQNRAIESEVRNEIARVISDGAFILGPDVAEFEAEFAAYCEVGHCVGVANGTDALELIIRALDIGPGDEVVLPANTFIATALAVARAGATPVLVDCTPDNQLIDTAAAIAAVGERTRAIIAVDLFGQVAPFEAFEDLASAGRVSIIEDAAQSPGALRADRRAGTFGIAAGTSFYPGKNLGAFGDGGAVTTDDADLAERVRALRNYGSDRKYHHPQIGFNSRLDTIQAVVLRAKLARLERWNQQRVEAASRYAKLLVDFPSVVLPQELADNSSVWHLYVVRIPGDDRDRVWQELGAAGIEAGIHYPVPIHLQGAFAGLGYGRGDFPNAEKAAGEVLSLPIYPGIGIDQQARVVDALREILEP